VGWPISRRPVRGILLHPGGFIDERQTRSTSLENEVYADDTLEVSEELLQHVSNQGQIMTVKGIRSHRYCHDPQGYEVLVQWRGLEEIEDSWEPMDAMYEDVPVIVERYVCSTNDNKLLETFEELKTRKDK
jgi:Chromo (CHRromatin Organisation MOdifier) domain